MKIGNLLKGVVGSVAPKLAGTLGGPLAQMAVTQIAGALGVEPTEKAVTAKLQNPTPDDLLALKKAEADFEIRMRELDIDETKLSIEDVKDARKTFSGAWTPRIFAMTILLGFFGFVFYIVSEPWSREMEPMLNIILGGLLANVASVGSVYFGSRPPGNSK